MEALGIIFSLAGTLLGLVALVSLIVPLRFLRVRSRGQALGLLVVSVVLVFIAGSIRQQDEKEPATAAAAPAPSASKASTPPAAAPTPSPALQVAQAPPAMAMPADQAKFVAIVTDAITAYRSAGNEMAQGGTRATRRHNICAAIKSPQVRDWVGTISTHATSNDGKGVLGITLAKNLALGTWNNTFSDISEKTLIEPGSAVFNSAVQLKRGDRVVFSGAFVPDKDDCFNEKSMSLHGSMTDPDFIFRFSAIRKQ